MRFFAKNTRCSGLAWLKKSEPVELNSIYEKSQNCIDFFQNLPFSAKIFFASLVNLPVAAKNSANNWRVPNDVNKWTTKGFCQIPKTLIRRNFQKNRQILLLRIWEGSKNHVFESISGRRHAFLMRVEANTIYSMSSIYSQNLTSGFPELDFREQ